jgi:hypothetical protein
LAALVLGKADFVGSISLCLTHTSTSLPERLALAILLLQLRYALPAEPSDRRVLKYFEIMRHLQNLRMNTSLTQTVIQSFYLATTRALLPVKLNLKYMNPVCGGHADHQALHGMTVWS